MRLLLLSSFSILLASCGNNPQVKGKAPTSVPQIQTLTEALSLAPELIVRSIETNSDTIFNFGDINLSDNVTQVWEIQNIGKATAFTVRIDQMAGRFGLKNKNCPEDLRPDEKCQIVGRFMPEAEEVTSEKLVIHYSSENKKPLLYQFAVVGRGVKEKTEEKVNSEQRLTIIPKNYPTGPIYLKDIPVGGEVEVHLEVVNTRGEDIQGLKLGQISSPFEMASTNCREVLKKDEKCDIFVHYKPTVKGDTQTALKVSYDSTSEEQLMIANAIEKNNEKVRIVVDSSVVDTDDISQLGLKADQLSDNHEIVTVDLGEYTVGKNYDASIVLNSDFSGDIKIDYFRPFQQEGLKTETQVCLNEVFKKSCRLTIVIDGKKEGNLFDVLDLGYSANEQKKRLTVVVKAKVKKSPSVECKSLVARTNINQANLVNKLTKSQYELPYKEKSKSASLKILFNKDSNFNIRLYDSKKSVVIPSVKNAMVQFGFDLKSIDPSLYSKVMLELDIVKINTEGAQFDTTEVLCLNETRTCSGTKFHDSKFRTLNTDSYQLAHDQFSRDLKNSILTSASSVALSLDNRNLVAHLLGSSSHRVFRLRTKISLSDYFGDITKADLSNGLNFILADDSTLISMPKLIFKNEMSCK